MLKRLTLLASLVSAVLVASCVDQPTAPATDELPGGLVPSLDILDGRNGGNLGFYWLSPMVRQRPPSGRRDRDLNPVVEVCVRDRNAADGCVAGEPLIATFSRDAHGLDGVFVGWFGNYNALWVMNQHPVERDEIYRIRVLLSGVEVGFADVIALRRREVWRYRSPQDDELIPISEQGAFPIRFRLLDGVLNEAFCDPDGDNDFEDCDTGTEIPGDGQPTVVQIIAQNSAGETIVAAVVTAPDGVFVDEQGQPVAEVVLAAEVELVPPSEDVFTNDNLEFPFFIEINTTPANIQIAEGSGVTVVICQDLDALAGRNVTENLHPQFIAYKVTKPRTGFPDGQTLRLETNIGAPECLAGAPVPAPIQGAASLIRRGATSIFGLLSPEPVAAFRNHGGLNTIVRKGPVGEAPFSTFAATLGPNADSSFASVPDGAVDEVTAIDIQIRSALGDDFVFGMDTLAVEITSGPNAGATVSVTDDMDGTYSAEYTPTAPGSDEITIRLTTFDGTPLGEIGGSPYTSVVEGVGGEAPVIENVIPGSLVGDGQMVTVQGTNFPESPVVQFFQGESEPLLGFVFSATETEIVVRLPAALDSDDVTPFNTGMAVAGDGVSSNLYPVQVQTTAVTPVVIEVRGLRNYLPGTSACSGNYRQGGASDPYGFVSTNSERWAIGVQAHGFDTTGGQIEITQNQDGTDYTWTLSFTCATNAPVDLKVPLPNVFFDENSESQSGDPADGTSDVIFQSATGGFPTTIRVRQAGSEWSAPFEIRIYDSICDFDVCQ